MGEWKEYKIGQIVEVGSSKRIFYKEYVSSGIPFYRSKEIIEKKEGKEIAKGLYIKKERFYEIKEKYGAPIEGDLLLSSVGHRSGIPYVVKVEGDFYFKDGNLIWLRNFNKELDSVFLYHWINSSIGQNALESIMIGSAQKALTISGIKSLDITIPPLSEQKAITSVLSSLEDKIYLLHRQNKTLETMAEILFRQWFVEEAREDWVDGQLKNVLELIYGKGLKEDIRTGEGFPVIGSNGVIGYHTDFLVEGPGIVIGRKGTLGKVIYIFENFFPIDTTYYVTSKVNSVGLFYEYFLLKSLNFEDMNSDSAVPGLNRDIALSTEIKIAPLDKVKEFNQFCSTFLEKLNSNNFQICTLVKLRDTLLPKLMSGEVRVEP